MACLTIQGKRYSVPAGTLLSDAVGLGHSLDLPCGGHARCGKCRVKASGALSPVSEAEARLLRPEELSAGIRLACCTTVLGDCQVELSQEAASTICADGAMPQFEQKPVFNTYGAAVDLGTTTLAAQLYGTAGLLAQATSPNPQGRYGADVISRIGQALQGKGHDLALCIRSAISTLLEELAQKAGIQPDQIDHLVVTGNTAMLYLLTETDPDCLSHAPFEATHRFGEWRSGAEFGFPCPQAQVYLPRCISAFVGADLTTALLASGLWQQGGTALLADIGTNGEVILCRDGVFSCCSTAAGPAFEGAGLSMGMAGKTGAVDHIAVTGGRLAPHVIGDSTPAGICGSGVVDAIAALLELEQMDETGLLDPEPAVIAGPVVLTQQDVRMVQLAKSAICAGIRTLAETAGLSMEQVGTLAIAGGFGSFLNLESAGAIGLIPPELVPKARTLGNAALTGAAMLLLNQDFASFSASLADQAETVDLSTDPRFQEYYVEGMFF